MDDFVDVQRLTLYAFYKQAHFGKCTIDKPSAADFVGSAKW
jgi:acyl-CoA-binding protein